MTTTEEPMIKVLDKGFVRLVDSMGDDDSIVQAARVSYGKGTKKVQEDRGLIRYLMRHRHTTPFEMVQFKFHIKAPIFVFRQWHRHRMWSYNEYSGRYSEMKDEFYVPEPSKITKQNPNNKQGGTDEVVRLELSNNMGSLAADAYSNIFDSQQKLARGDYERHLSTGMRKELARINLPLAQYSEMYGTVDLHNLFHFLKLRMDPHAQYEIRVYGDALAELIRPVVPVAFEAFEDYVLDAVTFSRKEMALLLGRYGITEYKHPDEDLLDYFGNKREADEFVSKITPK